MRAREIVRSSRRVLVGLAARGVSPSPHVVDRTAGLMRRNPRFLRRTHYPLSAYVYPVVSGDDDRTYYPTIVFDERGGIDLDASHCTCDAGYAKTMCHHLLGALVHADHLGFRLEASS